MKNHLCIMVVDDEQEILRLLKRILESEGYDVALAPNGGSALVLLEEHRPDLVILDIKMPGLNGFEVLRILRERYDTPVIMLTAVREVTSVRDAIGVGADDYVTKPFNKAVLLARIKAKLRRTKPKPHH